MLQEVVTLKAENSELSRRIAELEKKLKLQKSSLEPESSKAPEVQLNKEQTKSRAIVPSHLDPKVEVAEVRQGTPSHFSNQPSHPSKLPSEAQPPPPPFPGSGAPQPPPLPGTAATKHVRLATSEYPGPTPSVRMRPFHWKKLPLSESSGTVWSKTKAEEWNEVVALLEPATMQILFSACQNVRSGSDTPVQTNRQQRTALIDLRRAQNVSILLSNFRCTVEELKQAVISLDSTMLTVDRTLELLKFIPSEEEIEVLKAYTGEMAGLGSAERFFLEISGIPRYKERLQVHHFILTFDDRCAELDEAFSRLINCLTEVTRSKRLHRFMLHVLAVGNFMNHGTSMGNAATFRLEVEILKSQIYT